MLQSSYKYSSSIDAKREKYSTESLLISLLLEQQYNIKNVKPLFFPPSR